MSVQKWTEAHLRYAKRFFYEPSCQFVGSAILSDIDAANGSGGDIIFPTRLNIKKPLPEV
jgi:hypothetical protein